MKIIGHLTPLQHSSTNPITYFIHLGERCIALNDYLGKKIQLFFLGEISCQYCHQNIKKTYGFGSCYNCFRTLAKNDFCMIKPSICHYHHGTCRDAHFGDQYCMQPHIVYLANSSHVKIGITNKKNMVKRWINQGAIAALPIMEVPSRKIAGEIELFLTQFINDKTNWRKMLVNNIENEDLQCVKNSLVNRLPTKYLDYVLQDQPHHTFHYPTPTTLKKVVSIQLKKQSEITGILTGIKAQYLLFDIGVFQVKNHTGYKVAIHL